MSRVDDYCPPAAPIIGGRHDFGASSCWRARGIRDHLLMYTYAGGCRIGWAGGELRTKPGDLNLIAPRVPHDYGRAPDRERWGVLWLVFRAEADWLDWLDWPEPVPGIMHLPLADPNIRKQVEQHLDQARVLAESGMPNRDLLAMNALEAGLLWCRNQAHGPGGGGLDQRLKRGIAFMCDHLADTQDVAAAARAAGVSPPHFTRLFRRHVGTSPQRFLAERRLDRASALLRATPLPVADIAAQCGFTSAFYFSTCFRRQRGTSPSAYRAEAAAGRL